MLKKSLAHRGCHRIKLHPQLKSIGERPGIQILETTITTVLRCIACHCELVIKNDVEFRFLEKNKIIQRFYPDEYEHFLPNSKERIKVYRIVK